MAKKELAFEASVDIGNGAKSIKTLKQDYKEAQQELNGLTVGTQEYIKQLEKLGGIKDSIGDLNAEIAAFNPEGKVAAFGNVIGGLASGFQAAQGAAALFGAEGEELQKTLLKVQAASAFADGIKGIAGLKDQFIVLGNVIKANPLLMIATIIAGIGTALFALKDKIGIVGDAFDAIGDAIGWVTDKIKEFTDWIGLSTFAMDEQRDSIIKNNEDIKKSVESRYNAEIRAAKRAGEATEGLEIQKLSAITQANDAIIKQLKLKGDERSDDEQKTLDDLLAANRNYYQDILDLADASADREKERRAKEYQDYLAHIAKYGRGGEIGEIINANQVSIQEQTVENELRTIAIVDVAKEEQARKDLEREQANQDAIRVLKENAFEESKQFLMATQAISDLVFDHQLKQAQGNANAERKIRKKQFQVNKAFGIANSVIDGVQAVQKALNNPYPLNIILAAASGIMATANTIRIAKTEFNDGGGGGTGGGISGNLSAAGGGTNVAPPSTGSTLLNSDGTIKKQTTNAQPMVKAYVTETDISSTQKRVNSIEEKSQIK
jgi:hypothetical protein